MGDSNTTGRARPAEHNIVCLECGARDVIQIEMSLPDGTQVLFCSCHQCESRWWNRDGQALELDAVLQMVRSRE